MKCALCQDKKCYEGKVCIEESLLPVITEKYAGEDLDAFRKAAFIEARYYMKKTRLQELILYAKEMKYTKLGMAFCIGMENEAKTVHKILTSDFDVHSVCCKVCGLSKDEFGLEKIHGEGFEATCNPIGQATILNREETDLNIILGLCIGHDILFTKHSKAPVTTLAVKDRVLAHNPLGAIYSNYYLEKVFNYEKTGDEQNG
jgi:uncharacterized metal-binding protein